LPGEARTIQNSNPLDLLDLGPGAEFAQVLGVKRPGLSKQISKFHSLTQA
jgi:hypothetical protein